jgi:hypothetical protein
MEQSLKSKEESVETQRPKGEKRRKLSNILKKIPAKQILKVLINNKHIVFITLGLVITVMPKNSLATVLNQQELSLKQEMLETAKRPVGSFVSYLRSYMSVSSWASCLKNGFSENFYYYTKPIIKKVEPLIIFGSGVLITKLVYEKVLDYEADLCSTITSNLRTDIKMLELLLKIKNVKK